MGEIGKLLKEIEEAEKDEPKLTLAVIRKKYKGKKIDLSKLPEFECSFMEKTMELDWEFTYLRDWSGATYSKNSPLLLPTSHKSKKGSTDFQSSFPMIPK